MHKQLGAIAFLFAGMANAAPVLELEGSGTAVNNSVGTAQAVNAAAFTLPKPPSVFNDWPSATISGIGGASDVDFYSFATAGGGALFDIDNSSFTFDSILSLFNSAGTLVAYADDSFQPDPGSANGLDSFVGTIDLAPGTYYVAVTEYSNFASATFDSSSLLARPDGFIGGQEVFGAQPGNSAFSANGPQAGSLGYTLHISLENVSAIPEPTSWALLLAGLGLLGFTSTATRRRR